MPAAPDHENSASPLSSWWLNHVAVRVPDFEAGVRWFSDTLDFRLVHSWPYAGGITFGYLSPAVDHRVRIELMGGGPDARFKPAYAELNESLSVYGFHHVGFRVDDVDETIRVLKK